MYKVVESVSESVGSVMISNDRRPCNSVTIQEPPILNGQNISALCEIDYNTSNLKQSSTATLKYKSCLLIIS